MATPSLPYDDQYATIVREVHKRAPRPLGPPALVWHIAGWHAFDRSDEPAYEAFNLESEAFVESLYDRVGVETEKRVSILSRAFQRHDRIAFTDGGGVVTLEFDYGGAIFKVVVGRHYEHSTLTMSLDLSKPPDRDRPMYALNVPEAEGDVAEVHATLRKLKQTLDDIQKDPGRDPAREAALREHQAWLYQGFWTRVVSRLGLGAPFLSASDHVSVFADFRGLVLNAGDEANDWTTWERIASVRAVAEFDAVSNLQAVDRALPFVGASSPNWRDSEFVICNYIGRRVIYASALGAAGAYVARPHNQPPVGACEPLNYLILTNGLGIQNHRQIHRKPYERWQLGRLIGQINQIGTLRLLGLRDLERIHGAGDRAIDLGKQLDELFRQSTGSGERELLRSDLEAFFGRLNELSDSASSGLFYRINASRQAFGQFQRGMEDLKIDVIEGYQPYDEFMRRRLFAVYEEIDRIGIRIDRLYERANTLLRYLDAKTELTTLKQQQQEQRNQTVLQRAADVMIPVAGGHYLADVFEPVVGPWTENVLVDVIEPVVGRLFENLHLGGLALPLQWAFWAVVIFLVYKRAQTGWRLRPPRT